MASQFSIRPTRPDHPQVVQALAELDRYLLSLYTPEENHILDMQALLAPEVTFLAAWLGGELIGCGAVRRMPGEPDTQGAAYGEIKRMYVAPAQRGHGIAERLLVELENQLRSEDIHLALLETGGAQTQALRLYERCGYRPRAAFGGYPDNGLSVFLAKAL